MTDTLLAPGGVDAQVLHFFSWVTGVSIELPWGFEEVGADAVSVTYADVDDDPGADRPLLRVEVVGPSPVADQADLAVAALLDGLVGPDRVVSRVVRSVDGDPAETAVVHDADGLLRHLSVVASTRRLLALVATTRSQEMLALLETAVDSVRVVEA